MILTNQNNFPLTITSCRQRLLELRFLKAKKKSISNCKYVSERKNLSKLLTQQQKNRLDKISKGCK